jgi:hypothetical protein
MLPFTVDEFFNVFRLYNEALWPAHIALTVLAVAGIALSVRQHAGDLRWVSAILALLWLWMAVAYHATFFRTVNPAAWLFAGAFALQGLLFARQAWRRASSPVVRPASSHPRAVIAIALVTYALVVYPIIGWIVGHRYPASPTFGVPCPTTIYTLGVLVWWAPLARWGLLLIPVAWSVVSVSAATRLGVPEDWGLPVAAALAVAAVFLGHLRPARSVATDTAA